MGTTGHYWARLGTVAECGWPAGGGESFRSSHGLLRKGSITPQPGKAWRGGLSLSLSLSFFSFSFSSCSSSSSFSSPSPSISHLLLFSFSSASSLFLLFCFFTYSLFALLRSVFLLFQVVFSSKKWPPELSTSREFLHPIAPRNQSCLQLIIFIFS